MSQSVLAETRVAPCSGFYFHIRIQLKFPNYASNSTKRIWLGRRNGKSNKLISRLKTFASATILIGTSDFSACKRPMTERTGSGRPPTFLYVGRCYRFRTVVSQIVLPLRD